MKKQLRFLYRYIFTTGRWRRWINKHTVMVTFVSLVFFSTLAWSAPYPAEQPRNPAHDNLTSASEGAASAGAASVSGALHGLQQETPAGDLTAQPTRTNTPFPPEFATNADQTMGVTLAGAVLVLIVIVGVLTFLPKKVAEKKGQ